MVSLRKESKGWVVDFNWNGKHTQRSFQSKQLAENVQALLEGWKDIQRAQKFIRDAIAEGLMNEEQRRCFELYINRMASDLTEGQKIQIQSILSEYKQIKKLITCKECGLKETKNYGHNICRKCYQQQYHKLNYVSGSKGDRGRTAADVVEGTVPNR